MHRETEQGIEVTSEVFTSQRNKVRIDCLQDILPPTIDTDTLSNFLGGETLQKVRARAKEFPLIIGEGRIYNLSQFLTDTVRSPLEEKFGSKSYLQTKEDDLTDKSEILTGDMSADYTKLWKVYENDKSVLLADHLGHLRMDAVSYKLIGEIVGPLVKVIKKKLAADITGWMQNIAKEVEEIPAWLERKGGSKEKRPKTGVEKNAERIILAFPESKSKIDQLVAQGVDLTIAEARVLAAAITPRELSNEAIEEGKERLVQMQTLYAKLQEEVGRFAEVTDEVVNELLNINGLDQISEMAKFGSRKK